jgi:hypothetical protein
MFRVCEGQKLDSGLSSVYLLDCFVIEAIFSISLSFIQIGQLNPYCKTQAMYVNVGISL